jgi:hypothetical protein
MVVVVNLGGWGGDGSVDIRSTVEAKHALVERAVGCAVRKHCDHKEGTVWPTCKCSGLATFTFTVTVTSVDNEHMTC